MDGRYLLSYPESLGTPDYDRAGRRITREIEFPNRTKPVLHSSVQRLPNGRYRYSYRVQNAANARQAVRKFVVEIRSPQALADVRIGATPANWGAVLETHGNQYSKPGIVFEASGGSLLPGQEGAEFGFDSIAKPGITTVYSIGETQDEAAIASLPVEVRTQIERARRLGLGSVHIYGIGPKHPPDRNYYAVAADFVQMISRVELASGQSPFLQAVRASLTEYMEAVRNSTTEIEGVLLPQPELELEDTPKNDLETSVTEALRLSLDLD